ncbi:serine hydrolase domain-containing protein [Adhaeribacter radiodurans]|uniref:Serine hydrolase n=1 Tax=Adhaeribacter radiodurans TaxID=2745197 RepID=A0A7L7LDP6_9BACT|nr:serine hydrolase [Adhaeribacter radiodurans]QMU30877.1 serine hydrolase [Adhaeribacter radiodurans]
MLVNRRDFLKQIGAGAVGVSFIPWVPSPLIASTLKAGGLPRSTPEQQGLSSAHILAFIKAVEEKKLGLHSLMVVRNGQVVAEGWWAPYAPELKHTLFSLSKSFTSTAIGLAVAEGKLKVTDKVISFFSDDKPATVSPNLAAMRIKDLLTMTTGHEQDTIPPLLKEKSGDWARKFLSLPVEREPGTHFLYNTGATYMLSAILQKVTGQTVLDYLTPRLFKPLGIEGADWENSPDGINTGGFGLRVRTEDIAKFGQLYLQKGKWNGKQILPAAWVEEATAYQVPNAASTTPATDWNQGYGYQFWRSQHGNYRGDGAMGQYCLVMPEQNTIIAITSETHDMQAILTQVWDIIFPNLKPSALLPDKKAQTELKQKLASLTLLPAKTSATSPLIASISGKTFRLQDNPLHIETVAFSFAKNACTVELKDNKETYRIVCGLNNWVQGETRVPGNPPSFVAMEKKEPVPKEKIAAFGTWTSPDTFTMTWVFNQTPHSETITCNFENNSVRLEFKDSISAKAPSRKKEQPILIGQMIG